MNIEQVKGLKKMGIAVTEDAKQVVGAATAFGWQPVRIDGHIMVLGVYDQQPLSIIDRNKPVDRTDEGKIVFWPIDLEGEYTSQESMKFCRGKIIEPMQNAKFGSKAQVLFNEALKMLVAGDYERASHKMQEAGRGNPDYLNVQKHINTSLNKLTKTQTESINF